MRPRHLALLAFALLAPACSPTENYTASLVGGSAVPPVQTGAQGNAAVTLDPTTNLMTYQVAHAGLSGPVTGAHIHGPAGTSGTGPIVVPFRNTDRTPIQGSASLTNAQVSQLRAGSYYINVHTARNPTGEIRGQIRP